MGNDGGSIPTRRELVKEAARDLNSTELKETIQEQQTHNWTTCPLSQKPLTRPIVSDSSGSLYNKDAVLEFLLPSEDDSISASKTESREILQGRISSIRDVVTVQFLVDSDDSHRGSSSLRKEGWVCPVTGKELGPSTKAVYLVPCGHAFSKLAIAEVQSNTCLQCNEPFTPDNVIPILPLLVDEKAKLNARIAQLKEQGLTHSLKKATGSGKKRKHATGSKSLTTDSSEQEKLESSGTTKRIGDAETEVLPGPSPAHGIKDAATAALTAKVLAAEREQRKRRKFGMNENLKSLYAADTNSQGLNKTGDFMTRGYTIPRDARH